MKVILLTAIITLLMAASCKDHIIIQKDPPPRTVFYENSFETEADLEGWTDIQINMLDESTSRCGERSLLINGDCIQPTTSYTLQFTETSNYRISCWGKVNTENQKGMLVLREMNTNVLNQILTIEYDDMEWEFRSADFEVEAGTNVSLELMIGGIIAAGMNIDCIKIEKI